MRAAALEENQTRSRLFHLPGILVLALLTLSGMGMLARKRRLRIHRVQEFHFSAAEVVFATKENPMRLIILYHIVAVLFLLTPAWAEERTSSFENEGVLYNRTLIPHPEDSGKRVELYWTRPEGPGRYPVILFVHGYQRPDRNKGGKVYVDWDVLAWARKRGYAAAAVSQPGFGKSDGPRDFCGPFSQRAVLGAVRFLRRLPFANPDKVGLFGYSRDAIVASMAATKDTRLAAVALAAGIYDLKAIFPTGLSALDANIMRETRGGSKEAFRARSAMHHANHIKTPVLLLHGSTDERAPVEQAESFAKKLKDHKVPVTLKIFYFHGHRLPYAEMYTSWVYPFFGKHLMGK